MIYEYKIIFVLDSPLFFCRRCDAMYVSNEHTQFYGFNWKNTFGWILNISNGIIFIVQSRYVGMVWKVTFYHRRFICYHFIALTRLICFLYSLFHTQNSVHILCIYLTAKKLTNKCNRKCKKAIFSYNLRIRIQNKEEKNCNGIYLVA